MGNFLYGFTLHHAHYIFIRVLNDLVYYREGGRQYCFMSLSALLFDRLGSSACCHWTAENVDHILEFGDKMNLDSLQQGLIPNTDTLFRINHDSQLYIVINPHSDRSAFLTKIELCVSDVFTCCTNNGLAGNPGKTEVVHFRSCHARTCEPIKTITVGNAAISAMPVVRDLGALLDQHLLLKKADQQHMQGRLVCYTKK